MRGAWLAVAAALLAACGEVVEHHRIACSTSECPYPGPANTGWRPRTGSLTPYSGSAILSVPGQVLSGVDVAGCLRIAAAGVVVRQSRVRGDCGTGSVVDVATGGLAGAGEGVLLEDVEVDGSGTSARGVSAGGKVTLRRIDVHGVTTGVDQATSEGVTLEESWVHDLWGTFPTAFANRGWGGTALVHDSLEEATGTGALIFTDPFEGPVHDLRVERCLLNGGAYAVFGAEATFMVVTGNRFGRKYFPACGSYGPVATFDASEPTNQWSDNTYEDGEQILP